VFAPNNGDTKAGVGADASGDISLIADNGGTATERLRITGTTAYFRSGSVAIGTSTPYSRLTIWGSDTASSAAVFSVVNNASTSEFTVFDGGNAQLAGTLTQNSDARLKTNVESLDASSSLAAIEALTPVTFNWIDPEKGSTQQLGFIAQQVLPIFPNLVSTTSPTALTPNGTLGLNYIGFIPPIVKAIQALSAELNSIENTIAGFAQSFTTKKLTFDRATGKELCLQKSDGTNVCVTGDQLAAAISGASSPTPASSSSQTPPPSSSGAATSSSTDSSATPPVMQVNGDNRAIIHVGATYNDLGAIITGPTADLNLGITTYVNGTLMNPIKIDTTQAATDTIDYVATDQYGLTSTSTRTVVIQAPSIVPTNDASSTATSSAQ
jgi:Chaperone of endosialidase